MLVIATFALSMKSLVRIEEQKEKILQAKSPANHPQKGNTTRIIS